ncbi:hypothetical protein IHV25_04815 [Phaeovibrio sulfidiphilus]|uniref:Uncharacterized protein n=1 Tax=Phaeovibrio sulfidiphilus TaxID=1220600 RepID=A0A8J6YPP2_9PROT|nr:hypothetical protein [Phaeovibrio sulfidiphilus]MBE1236967.1 hypothetical protein [Phaeovibrio sulfidiphilus]
MSRSDCLQLLTRHVPRADVNASGGRDVRGKPVKGADLEDWSRWSGGVENGFTFLLYVDPFLYRKGQFPRGVTSTDIPIGVIHYDARTGDLSLDGEVVNDGDRAQLVRQCTEALDRPR